MAEVIEFPAARTRAHVALSWDHAWDSYVVQTIRYCGPSYLSWCDDYGAALRKLTRLGVILDIPAIDLTENGRVA